MTNKPLRKLMIRTWFGPLPNWYDRYCGHVQHLRKSGWDFWIINDLDWFRKLVYEKLAIRIDCAPGTRKNGDYDPALGVILNDYIKGYDFWGHVGLDCVFGRLDKFLPDERLDTLDVYGNDPEAICGPFSVYRNCAIVNQAFRQAENYLEAFATSRYFGWDETEFSNYVNALAGHGEINFYSGFMQEHDKQPWHMPKPNLQIDADGSLWSVDPGVRREIMMFHFNRKDVQHVWPIGL